MPQARRSVGPAKVRRWLLLIGVLLVAGIALAAFVIYLPGNGPDPDAAVKALLRRDQTRWRRSSSRSIAEEMARQPVSDLNSASRQGQPK
jgi:hypothetical protein